MYLVVVVVCWFVCFLIGMLLMMIMICLFDVVDVVCFCVVCLCVVDIVFMFFLLMFDEELQVLVDEFVKCFMLMQVQVVFGVFDGDMFVGIIGVCCDVCMKIVYKVMIWGVYVDVVYCG